MNKTTVFTFISIVLKLPENNDKVYIWSEAMLGLKPEIRHINLQKSIEPKTMKISSENGEWVESELRLIPRKFCSLRAVVTEK